MHWRRHGRAAALGALAALGAACGTSTEPDPGPEIDTQAALEDYETLDQALSSAELESFRALGDRTPFGGPAGVDAISSLEALDPSDGGRAFALSLFRHVRAAERQGAPARAPIISDRHRGSTFVYDPEQDDYRVDPDRSGAPQTGVRFVLYELDEAGFPIVSEEVGHADLVDEGDGSAEDIVLHLIVVHDETTVLDYTTTLDDDGTRGALTVRGFLHGDGVRLDFDIEAVGRSRDGVETLDVAWDLRVLARDFHIVGAVQGIREDHGGDGEVDVTVRHRSISIRVDVSSEEGTLDGTIFVNGDVFATVSGAEDDPTFVSRDGDPLTLGEMLVLRRIFDTIEDVFDFLEDLLDPVDDLVVLGIIL